MSEIITPEMEQIKLMITQTVAKRELLKTQMQEWYENHPNEKYKDSNALTIIDGVLSELDSHYKRLWDRHNQKRSA